MKLRDVNVIVCDCGAELNPEITTPQDFITYDEETKTATCSNCQASGTIEFPVEETPVEIGPTLEERVESVEDALLALMME
ncbi:MAG: hypothetical protein PHY08_14425 [Candidatus Cloacimonetes bacterium]|nr:hypothetical protein [Candidatus Cloacimonadota bacterium]